MGTVIKDHKLRHPEIEYQQITNRLYELAQEQPYGKLASKKSILQTLHEVQEAGALRTWYDQKDELVGLLIFQVGEVWWSDCRIVTEEVVLCLKPNEYAGIQREAIHELDRLANAWNARLINSGNFLATNQKLIENGYMKRGGYHHKSSSFLKIVKGEEDD